MKKGAAPQDGAPGGGLDRLLFVAGFREQRLIDRRIRVHGFAVRIVRPEHGAVGNVGVVDQRHVAGRSRGCGAKREKGNGCDKGKNGFHRFSLR